MSSDLETGRPHSRAALSSARLTVSCRSQALWIRGEETRKHNRQRQPPVCRAGPGPAGLRHRQLRLQDDEAVKLRPLRVPESLHRGGRGCLFWPGLDDVLLFCFLSVCFCFPLFFLSALLVCLDFGTFLGRDCVRRLLLWIQVGARGRAEWSRECDKREGRGEEKRVRGENTHVKDLRKFSRGTRTFQGFLLSFSLIDLPKVVATQVQECCSY